MKIVALGQFDFSRHLLVALARRGFEVLYGYVGKPNYFPEPRSGLECVPVARERPVEALLGLVEAHAPDVVFVGSASYDGSNRVAGDLLDCGLDIPIVRFYKELVVKPSAVERRVLRDVDGVVAASDLEAMYLTAVYGLAPARVHIFDPDAVGAHMIVREPLPKLSDIDGQPHVVIGGNVKADGSEYDYRSLILGLAEAEVHVHVYAVGFSRWLAPGRALDPNSTLVRDAYEPLWDHPFVHLEEPVLGDAQIREWSGFDVGLTQRSSSVFVPELTPFQEMNLPSKYTYYLAAGLPVAVEHRSLAALRRILARRGVMIEYETAESLAEILHDRACIAELAALVRREVQHFTVDAELPGLLQFVTTVVRNPRRRD